MTITQLLPKAIERLRLLRQLGAPTTYTVEVEHKGEWWRVSVERVDG